MVENRIADDNKVTEKDLVFYYSREKRLEKASPRVQALYDDQPKKRLALFSSLVDSKPKALLFTSIVVICLLILFLTYLAPQGSSADIGSNGIAVSALKYDGVTFIVLKKTRLKNDAWAGLVDMNVSAGGAASYNRAVFFSDEQTEEFRFSLPYESDELLFSLQAGPDTLNIRIRPE